MDCSHTVLIRHRAFTLVEILAVIAVIAVLIALLVPALEGPITHRRLTMAGEQFLAEINRWRESAATRNAVTELCLIRKSSDEGSFFSGVRTRMRHQDGSREWIGETVWFPQEIVMSPTLSSIIAGGVIETDTDHPDTLAYLALPIRPSGMMDPVGTLKWGQSWHVTLLLKRDLNKTDDLLSDFITFLIEPTHGRATLYRP